MISDYNVTIDGKGAGDCALPVFLLTDGAFFHFILCMSDKMCIFVD